MTSQGRPPSLSAAGWTQRANALRVKLPQNTAGVYPDNYGGPRDIRTNKLI